MQANRWVSLIVATGFVAVSSIAMAQNGTPAREAPRPQDVDPAVNTSATPPSDAPTARGAAPAREAPRPQDIEPRVNTSSPAQSSATPSEAAPGAASGAATAAAARGSPPSSAQPAAPGAPTSGAAQAAAKPGAKGKALDRLELDTTQITGNRELPKVLYIVPWKRSDLGDLVGKPINSLLDEVLTPVDRDVFQRENRYYRALTPGAAENDALSAADGAAPGPQRKPVPTNSAPAAGMPGSATYPVPGGSGSAASPRRDEK